jgi:predicted CopG family antitoxin
MDCKIQKYLNRVIPMYNMTKQTYMRADKELLSKLKAMKDHKKESYADVVRKLIQKEVKLPK